MEEFEENGEYQERYNKAYDALCNYLAVTQRSEKECVEKLYAKGYHKNEVDFAIEKAKSHRYIDDEEYVRSFISFNKARCGAKKIAYKLTMEKGIDKTLVDNLIEDLIGDDFELEQAKAIAEKYVKQKKIVDKSGYKKVSAYLYQKGFDFRIINKVMSTLFDVYEE